MPIWCIFTVSREMMIHVFHLKIEIPGSQKLISVADFKNNKKSPDTIVRASVFWEEHERKLFCVVNVTTLFVAML